MQCVPGEIYTSRVFFRLNYIDVTEYANIRNNGYGDNEEMKFKQ